MGYNGLKKTVLGLAGLQWAMLGNVRLTHIFDGCDGLRWVAMG